MKHMCSADGPRPPLTWRWQNVDGGVLNVGSGAGVTFSGYMTCRGISIASATNGEDAAEQEVNGGCFYNQVRSDALLAVNGVRTTARVVKTPVP